MQNWAISEYLTGSDRQLESVKGLGKVSDFTAAGRISLPLSYFNKRGLEWSFFGSAGGCLPAAMLTHSRG